MNRKGVSEVVATLILILLTLVVAGTVWVIVNGVIRSNISNTNSCYNITGMVTLNNDYTCYNDTANPKAVVFAVNVGDIGNVQDILVSISGPTGSQTFKINGDRATSGLLYLNGTGNVNIPTQNHGLTYVYPLPSSFNDTPQEIQIAPIVNGVTCSVTDSINQFDSCSILSTI